MSKVRDLVRPLVRSAVRAVLETNGGGTVEAEILWAEGDTMAWDDGTLIAWDI